MAMQEFDSNATMSPLLAIKQATLARELKQTHAIGNDFLLG